MSAVPFDIKARGDCKMRKHMRRKRAAINAKKENMSMPLKLATQSAKTLSNNEFTAQQTALLLPYILHVTSTPH